MFLGPLVSCRNVFGVCIYALIVLTSLSMSAGSASARARSDAMLVVDGSISMAGKFGKNSKISLVLKSIRPALKSAKPRLDLGVVFFGHRRRGDCDDVEHVIRLGPIFPKRYMGIIKGISTKGRAPISKAVIVAAGILKKSDRTKSIILVTDGIDACNKDFGKLGEKLQREFPDIKVNVIALRSKTSKMTALRKLAKRTGGKFATANTSKAIRDAVDQMFLTAAGGKIPIPQAGPRRLAQLAKEQELETEVSEAAPSAETEKIETVNSAPVEVPTLEIKKPVSAKPTVLPSVASNTSEQKSRKTRPTKTKETESTASIFNSFFGPGQKIQEIAKTPALASTILKSVEKPGRENIKTRQKPVTIKKLLTQKTPKVADTPAKPVKSQQSRLNLAARLGVNGPIIEDDLFWRIFVDGQNANPPKEIRQTGAPQPLLDLKPGKYEVTVQFGTIVQQQVVTIEANKTTDAVIVIKAGIIEARAVKVIGGKPLNSDISYTLLSAVKDNTGNRREISRKTASQTSFFVKPGRYYLSGKLGSATIITDITVLAGKTSVANLVFNTGVLKVSSVAGRGGAIIRGATYVVYKIQDGEAKERKEISRSSKNRNSFTLPVGTYRLLVQHGLASLERTVKVEANKTKALVFNLNAGYLKISARPSIDAVVLKDKVHYTIYKGQQALDGKREKIAQSTKSSPTFWLPAGDYFIVANYGLASAGIPVKIAANQRSEKTIIVNAGALRLSSKVDGLPEYLKSQVFYVIYDAKADLEGNYREVFSTSQAERTVRIPPGEYLIEGRWGNTNARTPVSAVVTAGKLTSAVVIHRAGRARFRLTSVPGGAPTGKPYWTFYDFSGAEIGRNVKPTPERIFSEGKYAVVVRYDDQEFKAEFSIKSGDRKQIDIVARQ